MNNANLPKKLNLKSLKNAICIFNTEWHTNLEFWMYNFI